MTHLTGCYQLVSLRMYMFTGCHAAQPSSADTSWRISQSLNRRERVAAPVSRVLWVGPLFAFLLGWVGGALLSHAAQGRQIGFV